MLCKSPTCPSCIHVTHICTPESHHHYTLPTYPFIHLPSYQPTWPASRRPTYLPTHLSTKTSPFLPISLPINPPYYLTTHLQHQLPPNPPTLLPAFSPHLPRSNNDTCVIGQACWGRQCPLQHFLQAILHTSSATYLNQVCWSAQCEAPASDARH